MRKAQLAFLPVVRSCGNRSVEYDWVENPLRDLESLSALIRFLLFGGLCALKARLHTTIELLALNRLIDPSLIVLKEPSLLLIQLVHSVMGLQ